MDMKVALLAAVCSLLILMGTGGLFAGATYGFMMYFATEFDSLYFLTDRAFFLGFALGSCLYAARLGGRKVF
jgi:hypothetical protein